MDGYFQRYSAYSEVEPPSPDLIWLSEKPLLETILKTRNPKSIKPTDYRHSNIINADYKYANKKKSLNSVEKLRLRINKISSGMLDAINYKYYHIL